MTSAGETPSRGAAGEAPPTRAARLPLPRLPKRTAHGDAAVFGPVPALLAAVAEIIAHALALPRLPWAIGAGIAAACCSAVARYVGGPTSVTLWQVTAFCGAAAWLGWARFAKLTTAAPWLWLAGTAVLLATAYPLVRKRHARLIEAERRLAEERARLAEQNRWPRLLEKIGHPGVTMTGREETGSGYVLRLRLPGSGRVTISQLRNDVERLEVAADVRRGSLHFEDGETARDVLLHVSTRDFLAETIPYEDNGEPLTIHNPIPIGRYEDGTACELTLREIAVLICGLRGSGKALALDTPVPTPDGWTTMGEIRAGDVVYDETGSPCKVTDAWDVRYGRPCYEIEFSDGSRIVADADHQWEVYSPYARERACYYGTSRQEVLTTEEIGRTLRTHSGRLRHAVRLAQPVQFPHRDLPVDPYVLGMWLGDGYTYDGCIALADDDREIIQRLEQHYPVTRWGSRGDRNDIKYGLRGLKADLRSLGVLGNKHIPAEYLTSSVEQRLALLQGLMDSDGTASKRGHCSFVNANERIVNDLCTLVSTLGGIARKRAIWSRPGNQQCYRVGVSGIVSPFHLPRKAKRVADSSVRHPEFRLITDVRPVPSVAVRCIAVDSPSHLYLVGETCIPTHNSNLLNVLIAQLVRCVDVLVFVIDTKYRLVMPWVRPYLEDEASGMAVDWAATSRSEAELMLRAFNRGIAARAASGGGGEEKIEPEPGRPAVFLVIDELASIFGIGTGPKSPMEGTTNTTLAGLGTDAVRLGRSEAMDLIAASQRGSVTMLGSGDFRSQFAVQIGLRVANEADARSVIPDNPHAARILASLRHEGTGLVRFREGRGMRVKFFRITPQQIAGIARRYGPMKPAPEDVLAGALGEEYASRWERFRASGKALARAGAAGAANATDQRFREITSQLSDIDRTDRLPVPRRRVREFIGRSGQRGVTVTMIVNLLDSERRGVDEPTVRQWLAEDAASGILEGTSRGLYRLRQP